MPSEPLALPSPAELVRAYTGRARKSLGQHFLTDARLLDRIVALAQLQPGERVVEIGPGPGGLTVRLLATGAQVDCIDADPDMIAHLSDVLGHVPTLSLRLGDATGPMLHEIVGEPPVTVVSNLPYYAATPILFALVDRENPPPRMALMFQLEVARRVVASSPGRDFGPVGIAVGIHYHAKIAVKVPAGAFVPPPKVDSAVVQFVRREAPLCDAAVEREARALARLAFGQRRKMLRRSLASAAGSAEELCNAAAVSPQARPEELDIPAFIRLGEASLRRRR